MMKFTNPIIPGFAPDPTIIFVQDTYILINSSFHVFPGLPIYTSKDLQNWSLRGHALSRPSQLSLSHAFTKSIPLPNGVPLIITGGLFAPTIRHYNKKFYLVCTYAHENPDDGTHAFQNFLLHCPEDKPCSSEGWSDAIPFDFPGIDPSLFFDQDTGKAYLHGSYRTGPPWAPDCSIRQFEIDPETGQALSETKFLWKGAAGKDDAEGPHIYFKDGWYYLLTAENTTFEGHQINVARSRDIWGPYGSCPGNPLLTAFGKEEEIRWTGHGDLVQDRRGNWVCVHLGMRHDDGDELRHPLGRETFLTAVTWAEGGWPEIAQTKMEFEIQGLERAQGAEGQEVGYRGLNERVEDVYIRTPDLEDYSYSSSGQGNAYSLRARASTLSSPLGTCTFVGRRQRSLTGSASTTLLLDVKGAKPTPQTPLLTGLTIYNDRLRHASIYVDHASHVICAELVAIQDDKLERTRLGSAAVPVPAEAIDLRIQAQRESYAFLWRPSSAENGNTREWKSFGEIDPVLLSGYSMTGTLYGIFATTDGAASGEDQWIPFRDFTLI